MRIVDIGICTNNKDPKGLGRVRYKPYGTLDSEIERSIAYEPWDENDQLFAIPFLPANINIVPQPRQSIKLIRYDTEKTTQNVEYVAGPFSTPHDFASESFTVQHKNTTYGGVIIKDLPDLKHENGTYIDNRSKGTIPELEDVGIKGNYGSDVIFTENGVVLSGGKLITKETPNKEDRKRLQEVPLLSEKSSKLMMKKFASKMKVVEEEEKILKTIVSKIKHIVEYEVDSLDSPTVLKIFITKVINSHGAKFDTNVFGSSTEIDITDLNTYKLINEDDSITTPTFEIEVDSIDSVCSELRGILYSINNKSLYDVNNFYGLEDLHPLFFRPTKDFRLEIPTSGDEEFNKNTIMYCYKVNNISDSASLIYSKDSVDAPFKEIDKIVKKLKKENGTSEQAFASLTTDLLFLLSTDSNKGRNPKINFNELDSYEYTQEDYLTKINDGTYSTVRGEELVKILSLIHQFLIGHVHNINKPSIYFEEIERELGEAIITMKTNLINESIRIN